MVNQWRSKIGVMYGDPRTTPGGQGKDYAYFTRLEIKRDDWIKEGSGQEATRVGQTIKVRVLKNKTAAPSQVALLDFYFSDCERFDAGSYDTAKEILALGIINKVIVRAGAYYRYAERQWMGQDAMLASLREEIELKETLEKDVLNSVLSNSKYVAETSDEE
jgi:recombination protein RecA